ncbi:MAG: proton-conducting transporter membrane subunit [Elusimicrobiota bacterium]
MNSWILSTFLFSLVLILVSGILDPFLRRMAGLRLGTAVPGVVIGSLIGLVPALWILWNGATVSVQLPWAVPNGSFSMALDPLSAFFLVPLFLLSALTAVYGSDNLSPFFNGLVASIALVLAARNGVLFLVAWEAMSLSSFFLVTLEHEKESVREAGWTYLVAMHIGTAFLLVLFILLGRGAGGLDFDRFGSPQTLTPGLVSILFCLAIVGFGTKAGFVPFHVWLPEAHPAAPSYVSALMSGVMIKTGIYGILRVLTFLGPPPAWWGWLLVGIGSVSGILGVLYALAQHDLKRLLAYHSVENIGIIALGLGVGLLGVHYGSTPLAVLGFGGGLLHVLNHAVFKGLLFLGAGSVLHATGTGEIDHLGGLWKRMPWTGVSFLVGSVAISGLPPFNGFVSEFLIYLGALKGITSATAVASVPFIAALIALGLIGGLAAACFTKAFGVIFLGETRSPYGAQAHEAGYEMRLPMAALAIACLAIGIFAPLGLDGALRGVLACVTRLPPEEVHKGLSMARIPLQGVVSVAFGLLVGAFLLAGLRRFLLRGRPVAQARTWGCGYSQPSARMQYTASSFAQPLISLFRSTLRTRRTFVRPEGLFPKETALSTETPDLFQSGLYRTAFDGIEAVLSKFRWLQHGRVQLYILYIMVTLLILLIWRLG